eukprot:scaffold72470_cov14-Tisochrysis_lutea.AAC.1
MHVKHRHSPAPGQKQARCLRPGRMAGLAVVLPVPEVLCKLLACSLCIVIWALELLPTIHVLLESCASNAGSWRAPFAS